MCKKVFNRFTRPALHHTILAEQRETSTDLGCAGCTGWVALSAPEQAGNCFSVGHWSMTVLQQGSEPNSSEQHLADHLDWNKWHIEITPSCSCKISGSAAFIFVCLFIHVFKRGRYFSAYEKPIPSRTEHSLHPTKAPQAFLTIALFLPVPLQSNGWKLQLCVDFLLLFFF